jgi:Zn-finger nucleic acid-binding protein
MTDPVRNASHVRCPGCGAPAGDPLLAACAYCRVALGTQACPACHTRLASGVAYCPWCGTRAVTPAAEPTAWRCPCGSGTLALRLLPTASRAVVSGTDADDMWLADCGVCQGVWLSREMIDRLVARHADDALLLALAPGLAPATAPRARSAGMEPVRYRRCPACDGVMNRVNYARISGIVVDVCRDHGTWFDVHELPGLLDFVRRGGLDRARARETAALAEERRRLERERLLRAPIPAPRGSDRLGDASPGLFDLLGALLRDD